MSKRKALYVPISDEALEELRRRAALEHRRPQDEAGLIVERALGVVDEPDPVVAGAGR